MQPGVWQQLLSRSASGQAFEVHFKSEYRRRLVESHPAKVALLISKEYEGREQEGFNRNGGIGTYYRALSQRLADAGWYNLLIVTDCPHKFRGYSKIPVLGAIFSSEEVDEVLELQAVHRAILAEAKSSSPSLDYQSFIHLFFTQAVARAFEDVQVYVEFHELCGAGFRTVQAREAGLLGSHCAVAVTMHGCQEWVNESHEKFLLPELDYFWQTNHLERLSCEKADLAFSHRSTCKKVQVYGWPTTHSLHQPNFIPLVQTTGAPPASPAAGRQGRVPVVFFGRLEERKGFCLFVDALAALDEVWRERIEVHFVGKVVELHGFGREASDSRRYLKTRLSGKVEFQLHTDLASQEAISLVYRLPSPIVCLTSFQENFPNTGLEMGQLPVRLVVSDVGGFRETLDIIGRTEDIHWFEPRNLRALQQALVEALTVGGAGLPRVPSRESIEQVNARLLAQKLLAIETVFSHNRRALAEPIAPAAAVTVLVHGATTATALRRCLESVAAQTCPVQAVIAFVERKLRESEGEAVQQVETSFPRCRFVDIDSDSVTASALEVLVELVDGDYLLLIGGNGTLLPSAVEWWLPALGHAQAELAACSILVDRDGTTSLANLTQLPLPHLLLRHRGDQMLPLLIASKLLAEYARRLPLRLFLQGELIFAEALATNKKLVYFPYPLYLHTSPPGEVDLAERLRQQHALRGFLGQIESSRWNRGQLHTLLSAFQQLSYRGVPLPSREVPSSLNEPDAQEAHNAFQLQIQYVEARKRIAAMESSKFWQLRSLWFKAKRRLGLPINE